MCQQIDASDAGHPGNSLAIATKVGQNATSCALHHAATIAPHMTDEENPKALSQAELERVIAGLKPKQIGTEVLVWTLTREDNEFVEVSASRSAIEITRGDVGTAGYTRSVRVKVGESAGKLVMLELARIVADGFRQAGTPPPPAAPAKPVEDEKIEKRVAAWRAKQKREGFVPMFAKGEGDADSSRIGGRALLGVDENEAPVCPSCEMRYTLFVQLQRAQLPAAAKAFVPGEILQFMICKNECKVAGPGGVSDSPSYLLRTITGSKPPRLAESALADPVQRISKWTSIATYPDSEQAQAMTGDPEFVEALLEFAADDQHPSQQKAQLLGWPGWLQGDETPSCEKCSKPMTMLVRIGEGLDAITFGDSGTGFIFSCEPCQKLAFVLQCT